MATQSAVNRTQVMSPAPAITAGRRKSAKSAVKKSLAARSMDALASVKFAVQVVIIITIACIAGTLIPQGTDALRYVDANPGAAGRMEFATKVGLTNVFSAWWFLGLLGLLSASIGVCSSRRFATMTRSKGSARTRAFGSMLTHISFLLILAGAILKGTIGEKGYLEMHEGETSATFVSERGEKELPFALRLADFTIETWDQPGAPAAAAAAGGGNENRLVVHWPDKGVTAALPLQLNAEQLVRAKGAPDDQAFRITVLRYEPDFVMGQDNEITSRSSTPNNPAVLVAIAGPGYHNHQWLFAKFPQFSMNEGHQAPAGDNPLHITFEAGAAPAAETMPQGPVKSFRSTLDVVENGAVSLRTTAEVNHPFRYKGYSFYQAGYNPDDLTFASLQVVKDPGVPVVYTGFSLMILGLFIVFYLNPWLKSREKNA